MPPDYFFAHLLFIYLQGDSLQTKQVIKSSLSLPLWPHASHSFTVSSPPSTGERRGGGGGGEEGRREERAGCSLDGSTASAEVISLANAAAHNCMHADLICIPSANPI